MCMHWLKYVRLNRNDWLKNMRGMTLVDVNEAHSAISCIYQCVGEMHLKDLLGSFVRVGYRIPVPDFYLVLHGQCCLKSTIMD